MTTITTTTTTTRTAAPFGNTRAVTRRGTSYDRVSALDMDSDDNDDDDNMYNDNHNTPQQGGRRRQRPKPTIMTNGYRENVDYSSSSNNNVEGSNGDGIFHNHNNIGSASPQSPSSYQDFTIDDHDDDESDNDDENDVDIENGPQPQQQHYSTSFDISPNNSNDNNNNHNNNRLRPPPNYICPLTLHLMSDPVNDNCGHTFDRQAIFDWLDIHGSSVCPISRRPMDKRDLFRNGHLKAQIEDWKDRHPYYHRDSDDNHNYSYSDYDDQNSSDILQVEDHTHSHSQFELMLLPQERSVLNIVKARAQTRRERRRFSRCMWCIGISVTLVIVIVTILAIKFLDVRLHGPL